MLDVAPTELLLVAAVAVIVIGPKDLPRAMRFAGHWVGKARGVARQFRQGFDDMVREAEFSEMEKKWAQDNARIMREFPADAEPQPALPAPTDTSAGEDAAPTITVQPELTETAMTNDQPGSLAAPAVSDADAPAPKPRTRRTKILPDPDA